MICLKLSSLLCAGPSFVNDHCCNCHVPFVLVRSWQHATCGAHPA